MGKGEGWKVGWPLWKPPPPRGCARQEVTAKGRKSMCSRSVKPSSNSSAKSKNVVGCGKVVLWRWKMEKERIRNTLSLCPPAMQWPPVCGNAYHVQLKETLSSQTLFFPRYRSRLEAVNLYFASFFLSIEVFDSLNSKNSTIHSQLPYLFSSKTTT